MSVQRETYYYVEYLKLTCQEDLQVFLIVFLHWQLHIAPNRGRSDETVILMMPVYNSNQGMLMIPEFTIQNKG